MKLITVNLTCVFETTTDRLGAQKYFMEKLNTLSTKDSFNLNRSAIVQWSSPASNNPQTFDKDGTTYYRYTGTAEFTFHSEDTYMDIQNEVTKAFADEYMNIQSIDVTGIQYSKSFEEMSLEEAQAYKHEQLKSVMQSKREVLKVSYDNDTFDANEDAQANMIVLLKAFDLGVTSVDIRSSTETTHSFNQSQCNELSLLMVSAVNSLYSTYWDLKDKLYACTTKEEIEAINWE